MKKFSLLVSILPAVFALSAVVGCKGSSANGSSATAADMAFVKSGSGGECNIAGKFTCDGGMDSMKISHERDGKHRLLLKSDFGSYYEDGLIHQKKAQEALVNYSVDCQPEAILLSIESTKDNKIVGQFQLKFTQFDNSRYTMTAISVDENGKITPTQSNCTKK